MDERSIELLEKKECTNHCPNCCRVREEDNYGDTNKKKIVVDHVKEYCSATSIHGVQYLGESGRPFNERLWWIIVFVISFLGNSYLVRQIWIKWNESPVIVTFAATTTPVWDIPFPTITICPLATYKNSEYNYQQAILNPDEYPENRDDLEALSLVCSDVAIPGNLTTDRDLLSFYSKIGVTMDEMFVSTEWRTEELSKGNGITKILTANGICYSFNILDYTEIYRPQSWPELQDHSKPIKGWSLSDGYLNDDEDNYPLRTIDSGISEGFGLLLEGNLKDFDYRCQGVTPGYKVVLSSPGEVPNVEEKFLIAEPDKRVYIGINPEIIQTSVTLKNYKPSLRKCYFPSERYLAHFKVYTQKNCELECLANHTKAKCNCISFYMPKHIDDNIPTCGPGSEVCVDRIRKRVPLIERRRTREEGGCDCLPSCTSTRYLLDVTQHKLKWKKLIELGVITDVDVNDSSIFLSSVNVYFADKQYTTSQRNELYGIVDFLANCGGLIGLFSGFSVLSIVEIIYFLTLRCWNNIKKMNAKKDSKQY